MPVASALPRATRWFAGLITAVCWLSLALQFVLLMTQAAALGIPKTEALLAYFSFFTLQVNILAAAVTSMAAVGFGWLPAESRIKPAVMVYLVSGGIIFFLLLRGLWSAHRGLQWLDDLLLHAVMPVLYAAFWLMAAPKANLRWRDPAIWLIYPLVYLAVVLLLAQRSGFYPYPFIDLHVLGAMAVAVNVAVLAAWFLICGLATVAIGRLAAARATQISD